MDKFLVKAYSQQAREVNVGTGKNSWEFVNAKWDINKVLNLFCCVLSIALRSYAKLSIQISKYHHCVQE